MRLSETGRQSEGRLRVLAKRLRLERSAKEEIILELEGHLEDKAEDLTKAGYPTSDAYDQAAAELGHFGSIARDMYAVHSRGSWRDILLATLPHLLLAALFAFNLLTHLLVLAPALIVVTVIAYKGWRNGKAKWAYSWLGYSLAAPAISWVMALGALAYAVWTFFSTGHLPFAVPWFILLAAYLPFSLWIIASVCVRVIKRDWLLASLTALPFPFLTSWVLLVNSEGGLWSGSARVHGTDTDRALVFLALAVTTAVFFKAGRRLVQIGLLTLSTALLAIYTFAAIPLSFGLLAIILVSLSSVAFLLSPAFLESWLERRSSDQLDLQGDREVVTHWFVSPG